MIIFFLLLFHSALNAANRFYDIILLTEEAMFYSCMRHTKASTRGVGDTKKRHTNATSTRGVGDKTTVVRCVAAKKLGDTRVAKSGVGTTLTPYYLKLTK